MPKYKHPQVELFRVKVAFLLEQYAKRMKIVVAENRAVGMSIEGIKGMRDNGKTKWAAQKELLNRDIKREVADLINQVHNATYTREMRG
ncbi:MAG: hypothetical protein ACYDH3_00315 [Candidatus Aminicenantales bacterium]